MENCALMVLILLMKNIAKSSAVRVDEGGGGGGCCFKEHLRLRRVVNDLMTGFLFSSGDISREGREE